MRLEEIRDIQHVAWHPLSEDEVASLWRFEHADDDDEELERAIGHEQALKEEIDRVTADGPKLLRDELIYVAVGNATERDDYLRLAARYGPPANRDLDQDVLLEYQALGEAVYRTCALLAFGEGLAESEDIEEVFSCVTEGPSLDVESSTPTCVEMRISIPDYRRVIYPQEVQVEDVNEVYWPPMANTAAGYAWKTGEGSWRAQPATTSRKIPGMVTYTMRIYDTRNRGHARLDAAEQRFFAGALANSIINDQLKDMRLSFQDGEVDLVDPLGAMQPPVWRMVWIALAQAKGKLVPSVCRTCGRLVDRRSERRSTTVSCNDGRHNCTAAFNNNGKRRMVKRAEWGREFKGDETFACIGGLREAVLEELWEQKADPD